MKGITETREVRVITYKGELETHVPTNHGKGTVEETINLLKEYESGFVFVQIEEPKIPGRFAVVNFSAAHPKPLFYDFVSRVYRILPTHKTLEQIRDALKNAGIDISNYEAWVSYGRTSIVRIQDNEGSFFLTLMNSYDRSSTEKILLKGLRVFKYRHSPNGLMRDDLTTLLSVMDDAKSEEWNKKLLEREISRKSLFASIAASGVGYTNILDKFFGDTVEKRLPREESSDRIWDNYIARYGKSMYGYVQFVNDFYKFMVSRGAQDIRITNFLTKSSVVVNSSINS